MRKREIWRKYMVCGLNPAEDKLKRVSLLDPSGCWTFFLSHMLFNTHTQIPPWFCRELSWRDIHANNHNCRPYLFLSIFKNGISQELGAWLDPHIVLVSFFICGAAVKSVSCSTAILNYQMLMLLNSPLFSCICECFWFICGAFQSFS